MFSLYFDIVILGISHFGFEGGTLVLIVSVPGHCLSFALYSCYCNNVFEPRCEKTGLRGFRPGSTQTGLYSHRRWLEA